jgi:hypothetical protein
MGNDELLTGANVDADTRLMLAVQEAMLPDPYDGVPADVTSDPTHGGKGGTMGDAAAAMPVTCGETVQSLCKQIGLREGIAWLMDNGWDDAARALNDAVPQIVAKFDH